MLTSRCVKAVVATLGTLFPYAAFCGVPRVVVVEEFGATWCNPCVPARCAMETLGGEYGSQIVYFETHYNDLYEVAGAETRALFYGVLGMPDVYFDGKAHVIGASSCEQTADWYRAKIDQRLTETGGSSPVRITGTLSPVAGGYTLDVTYELVDPIALTSLRATLFIYGDLGPWERATLLIHDQNVVLAGVGDQAHIQLPVFAQAQWPDDVHAVAILQTTTGTKEIIQGALLPDGSATGIGDGLLATGVSRIECARPNPFQGRTEIEFTLSPEDAQSPIRLEIVDVVGRHVASLADGRFAPGTHTRTWNGISDDRAAVGSGIYFARLTTPGKRVSTKLVRVRSSRT